MRKNKKLYIILMISIIAILLISILIIIINLKNQLNNLEQIGVQNEKLDEKSITREKYLASDGTQGLSDENVTLSQEEFNNLIKEEQWKHVGSAAANVPVDISGLNYETLYVKVSDPVASCVSLTIPYIAFKDAPDAEYLGSKGRHASVYLTNDNVTLTYYQYDGTNCTSTSSVDVYYK